MKALRRIFITVGVGLLFAAVLLPIGCKKEIETNEVPPTTADTTGVGEEEPTPLDTLPFVHCTINGSAFVSDTVLFTDLMGVRTYTAIDGNRRIILATSVMAPGNYALGSDDPSVAYQSGMTFFGPAFTNTGSLTIATSDSIGIDGTFSANVQDIVTTGLTIFLPDGSFGNLPTP